MTNSEGFTLFDTRYGPCGIAWGLRGIVGVQLPEADGAATRARMKKRFPLLREALDIAGPSGADRAKVLSALAHVAYGRHRGSEALGYIDPAIVAAEKSNEHELVSSLTDTRRAWAS